MASEDLRGVIFILCGMFIFSVQDVLIRQLADGGSLLQVLTFRGLLGAIVLTIFLRITGRSLTLVTPYPLLAVTRVILFFSGFLCFYYALSHMRLAEATALFFASPLFITAISRLVLKEAVGWYRLGATIVGFVGVLFIVQPSPDNLNLIALFPLFTACTYSISMMIARYTKEQETIWQQMMYLYIGSVVFGGVASATLLWAGIGETQLPSAGYIVRQWNFSEQYILLIMLIVAIIGSFGMLLLTSAYRVGTPAVIAPFEYSLLFLAGAWGYLFYGEVPNLYSFLGMSMIVSSSLFIFFREGVRKRPLAVKTSLRT